VYSRYRCRECTAQFWVINRKTRMAARMMLAGIVLAIIAVFLMDMVFNFGSAPSKRRSEALQFQKA
jgi:ABC-type cobalamin transport system permease subunit